jgi:hypothetical protein
MLQRIGVSIAWFGVLLVVVAIATGLLGWQLGRARYLFNIGVLVATLGCIFCVCALVTGLAAVVRRARFWGNEVSLLMTDLTVVDELAKSSPVDLQTLGQLLALRREILQNRQRFVLGPADSVSPFLVLLVALTVPHTDAIALAGQYAPWATQLAAGPAGWIGLGALVTSVVFARFRMHNVSETYATQIALVASALERATTGQTTEIALSEAPPKLPTHIADDSQMQAVASTSTDIGDLLTKDSKHAIALRTNGAGSTNSANQP